MEVGQWPQVQVFPLNSIHTLCVKPLTGHQRGSTGPAESEPGSGASGGCTHAGSRVGGRWTVSWEPLYSERGLQGARLQLSQRSRLNLPLLALPDEVLLEEGRPLLEDSLKNSDLVNTSLMTEILNEYPDESSNSR